MAKKRTSKKRRRLKKVYLTEHIPFTSKELADPKLVIDVLFDCIKEGDLDSFRGVLFSHLMTVNKMDIIRKAGIGRRTLYDLLDPKKEFNPELSTLSAVIRAIAA